MIFGMLRFQFMYICIYKLIYLISNFLFDSRGKLEAVPMVYAIFSLTKAKHSTLHLNSNFAEKIKLAAAKEKSFQSAHKNRICVRTTLHLFYI